MKKLLLFIGIAVFSLSAYAEGVPTVIINKRYGGLTGIFNRYNHVQYTPADQSADGNAHLICEGTGLVACRVPNTTTSLTVMDGNTVTIITDAGRVTALETAINDIISQYEEAQEQNMSSANKPNASKGNKVPSVYTKTLAFANSAGGKGHSKTDTYVVRGVVTDSDAVSSTMKIYIEKVNILSPVSGN